MCDITEVVAIPPSAAELTELAIHAKGIMGTKTQLYAYQARTLHWALHLERRVACGWGLKAHSNQDMKMFDLKWSCSYLYIYIYVYILSLFFSTFFFILIYLILVYCLYTCLL